MHIGRILANYGIKSNADKNADLIKALGSNDSEQIKQALTSLEQSVESLTKEQIFQAFSSVQKLTKSNVKDVQIAAISLMLKIASKKAVPPDLSRGTLFFCEQTMDTLTTLLAQDKNPEVRTAAAKGLSYTLQVLKTHFYDKPSQAENFQAKNFSFITISLNDKEKKVQNEMLALIKEIGPSLKDDDKKALLLNLTEKLEKAVNFGDTKEITDLLIGIQKLTPNGSDIEKNFSTVYEKINAVVKELLNKEKEKKNPSPYIQALASEVQKTAKYIVPKL